MNCSTFKNLTHLELLSLYGPAASECKALVELPKLSHLCFDFYVGDHIVPDLLEHCASLQVYVERSEMRTTKVDDPRYLVFHGPVNVDDRMLEWSRSSHELLGCWELAEVIIEARKRKLFKSNSSFNFSRNTWMTDLNDDGIRWYEEWSRINRARGIIWEGVRRGDTPASRGADCQSPPASDNRDLPVSRNADGMDPQPPPAPENRIPSILVDSMDTNDTSHLEKAAEQATTEQQPVLLPTHFFNQADREAPPAGRNVDGMDPQPASTPDNCTPSFPVDSMDTDNTSPPEKTAELAMSNHSILASQQPVFLPTDPFDQLPPADREALPIEVEDEEDMETDDLYQASSQDVLAVNAFHCVSFTSSLAQTVEDLVYYRFGFSLHEISYSGVPSSISPTPFRNWHEVVCAVGGQGMNVSGTNQRAITDFLGCILSSENPLRVVPGKFWDLSADGADPLNKLTPRFIRIEKRQFNDRPRYILRPSNLHPAQDTSWCIAVDALTALECIRRGFGPHSLDIANYFVDHGIPFSTLDHLRPTSQLPSSPSRLPRRVLGRRPKGYKFNLADYAAYVTLRDSYLSTQPHARATLCAGGIVARLARESLSAVPVLSGPSQSALEGKQVILTWNGQHFCDDTVSEVDIDLICGVYEVETGNKSKILILTSFPL